MLPNNCWARIQIQMRIYIAYFASLLVPWALLNTTMLLLLHIALTNLWVVQLCLLIAQGLLMMKSENGDFSLIFCSAMSCHGNWLEVADLMWNEGKQEVTLWGHKPYVRACCLRSAEVWLPWYLLSRLSAHQEILLGFVPIKNCLLLK